jgi:hypothetical protein
MSDVKNRLLREISGTKTECTGAMDKVQNREFRNLFSSEKKKFNGFIYLCILFAVYFTTLSVS